MVFIEYGPTQDVDSVELPRILWEQDVVDVEPNICKQRRQSESRRQVSTRGQQVIFGGGGLLPVDFIQVFFYSVGGVGANTIPDVSSESQRRVCSKL